MGKSQPQLMVLAAAVIELHDTVSNTKDD